MTQLYTKLKEDEQITDPLTSEILKINSDPIMLSESKKRINLKRRELENAEEWIDKILAPFVEKGLKEGADRFAGFWKIQKGALRFSEKLFNEKATVEELQQYTIAKNLIKTLTDNSDYFQAGKPSLRYPKF